MKTLMKLTALLGLFTWATCTEAHAGKFWNIEVYTSSGGIHVGYANGAASIRPGRADGDRVLTSSGAAFVYSTSTTSGYKVFRVFAAAATELLSLTEGGLLALTGNMTISGTLGVTGVLTATGGVVGNLTGNASGTAGSLAANGANCSAGNYPLGVDASGAVESCTAAGIGDVTKAGTNLMTGETSWTTGFSSYTHYNTITSSHPCRVIQSSTTMNIPADSGTNTSYTDGAIANSTVTITNFAANSYLRVRWDGMFSINDPGPGGLTVILDGVRLIPTNGNAASPVWPYDAGNANERSYGREYHHHTKPGAGTHSIALMAKTDVDGTWTFAGPGASVNNWVTLEEYSCPP